jgi:RNA polymerase subunit RPABC4/transcription elongation factor Spt4
MSKGYSKKCRYCAEIIKENAMVCKHCDREQPIEGTYVDADFTGTS